ncbi:hypothetical protein [Granulicella arctica]|uniref:Uncharacterized protein n=1 Tax=Granulicella arctica TaxID=940613 RepID=A0A7Y9TKB7_9BACT|nr:hypothetical protein [Granulicella arctica]NYF79107.1 hypothetical protein [Granulicella arctica]
MLLPLPLFVLLHPPPKTVILSEGRSPQSKDLRLLLHLPLSVLFQPNRHPEQSRKTHSFLFQTPTSYNELSMHLSLTPQAQFIWLVSASFLAGVMNAMAGRGSFLSFPAMMAMRVLPIQAIAVYFSGNNHEHTFLEGYGLQPVHK